ncbi:MAG: Hsp20/alpha crystallin family protein [Pseudomonadota bacterium]
MNQLTPFNALNELHRELSHMFDIPKSATAVHGNWSPLVDISESETGYTVVADLPGVKPEDVEVSLHNNVLTIRGERNAKTHDESGRVRRRERVRGAFLRQFTLPAHADEEGIQAKATNGVLEIRIPKAATAKQVSIAVNEE